MKIQDLVKSISIQERYIASVGLYQDLLECVKAKGMLVTTKDRFSARGLVLQQESATDLLRMLFSLVGKRSVAGQLEGSS